MENSEIKIAFLGREFGLVVRNRLQEAGYTLVEAANDEVDLLVVGFWGNIVRKGDLEKPKYGALNVHPSLLPKYRGPTPVPFTILNGEIETGVSIIKMDEEVDHGPLLAQREFSIFNYQFSNGVGKPTTPELLQVLWEMGADLLVEILPKWIAGEITPEEQDHSKATYTKKLTREDGLIDWKQNPEYIDRQIRAFYPWPGAFFFWKGKRVKILKAHVEQEKLIVDELQMEGKKPTTLNEFLLGHPDFTMPPER
ncbi:MAG TPA: methionyl-tRNA formyltransferase [Candidatus Paceibacterota bacterium]|nr:methionyl-tRNA formyltransferase [Candidatus Paceibacterota bacterium]